MDLPLISAILTTKGRSLDDLVRTIGCFRDQTYENKELVVVGNTYELSQAVDISGIALIDVPDYYSVGLAKNYGVEASKGSIIAQFDADYYYAPDRLTVQISTMANQGAHVVMLSKTLQYSGVSNIARYNRNKKEAILETMVFIRQNDLTFQNRDRGLELQLLNDLSKVGASIVTIDKPELCCKLVSDLGRAEIQNSDLSEDHYTILQEIIQQMRQKQCNPSIQQAS